MTMRGQTTATATTTTGIRGQRPTMRNSTSRITTTRMTGTEIEMYNDNPMTKMAVAEHNKEDDKHRTRTEGAGDRYSAV